MMFVRIYSICVRAVGLLFYIPFNFVCVLVIVQKEVVKEKCSWLFDQWFLDLDQKVSATIKPMGLMY